MGSKVRHSFLLPVVLLSVAAILELKAVTCLPKVNQRDGLKDDPGEPLFLTPLIDAGKAKLAKKLSLVTNLTDDVFGVTSYSGFFTVNKTTNSNLFFWFFPAANNRDTAPLLIWLQGGPGGSSLFGLFTENGPFLVDKEYSLQPRQWSWTLTHSVIYFDNPVGAGFSFTENETGYARNEVDVGLNLYNALKQFYLVFPEYKNQELYVTGESYAGKYVPALGYRIHIENQRLSGQSPIPLKGLALGDAFSDPVSMLEWGEVLYGFGILDDKQLKVFQGKQDLIKEFIERKEWLKAWEITRDLIFIESTCYMRNVTGMNFHYNIMLTQAPPDFEYFVSFLNKSHVRRALHVGSLDFNASSSTVEHYLREDILQSVKPWVEQLLNSGYRILYYTGQLDIIVSHRTSSAQINNFNWTGASEFKRAERKIWHSTNEIAGYVKEVPGLTYVMVRNAGHILPYDQPRWSFDLINRFTYKKRWD